MVGCRDPRDITESRWVLFAQKCLGLLSIGPTDACFVTLPPIMYRNIIFRYIGMLLHIHIYLFINAMIYHVFFHDKFP